MLNALTSRLRHFRDRIVDATIHAAELQEILCARYGYGLTVECEERTYTLYLPDMREDPQQQAMVHTRTLYGHDTLNRLRRRTRSGMTILDVGAGCGVRAVYMAASMQASCVHSLCVAKAHHATARKNAVLNDVEQIVHPVWLAMGESGTPDAPAGTIDKFCLEQSLTGPDLISLDMPGFELATLIGASETLKTSGPAIVLWSRGNKRTAVREALRDLLNGYGYSEPETWPDGNVFWMPRV